MEEKIPNYEEEINLLDILKFFVKHLKLILVITLIVSILGVVKYFLSLNKKYYTIESGIVILWPEYEILLDSRTKLQLRDIGELFFQQFENRKKSIQELILSPSVVIPVIKKAEEKGLLVPNKLKYKDFVDPNNKMIGVTQGGEIIKIRINMQTPELAKLFLQEITENVVGKIKEIVSRNIDKDQKIDRVALDKKENFVIKIAYISDIEELQVQSNKNYLLISILIGIFMGIFVSIIKEGIDKLKDTM